MRSTLVFVFAATVPQTMQFLHPLEFCRLIGSGAALVHQKPQASSKAAITTPAQAADDAGLS